MSPDSSVDFEADARRFATTHWSVVLAAGGNDDRRSREALAKLCATYWYPLYAFVRRQGYGPEDAEDLTQVGLTPRRSAVTRLTRFGRGGAR